MKKVKSKVVIGIVSAGLVISGGIAFASTNAGDLLTNWANTKTSDAKTELSSSYKSKYDSSVADMKTNVNNYKVDAANNIELVGDAQTKFANQQISAALNEHLTAISDALAALNMSIPADFANYISTTNGKTSSDLDALATTLNSSFNTQLSAVAKGADTKLQTNLNSSRSAAVNALTQKIQDAKAEINSLITDQSTASEKAVLEHLSAEITRIETALEAEIDGQKADAIKTLNDTSTKAINDATKDMQDLVDAINK
ncbi:hypothetical protein CN692_09175 [Bacillus sp. AFS002410]|uniref:hypothetical protein n=1 Tax=Bacillus sp. AFS002410 TaxID=2033481 RepID=UPI000BEF9D8C|nr:hypothetical protein [Bacillus sp. AFS002410]PEJ58433.1 hypothetical protein CN692_09175 [Bacillus sp. AFS002410]